MTERWTDETLDRFASTVSTAIASSNERLTRIEQLVETNSQKITDLTQVVASNNRFLESFSQDLRRYTDNMDRLTHQLAATTANNNQDRWISPRGYLQSIEKWTRSHLT
jgi:ABC-type transporter Mla subunit MlaD